ncbi:response regulator, partial [Sphingobium sp.]|uniref:response regulator n=1 Tax=Sphingobium sp. TaxID=1912891 RepID=UPI002C9B70FE
HLRCVHEDEHIILDDERDELSKRHWLCGRRMGLGLTVIEATSAEDAISALQTTHVDMLITDVNLSGMSGPELAFRARAFLPDIRIIFATGDSQLEYDRADARIALLAKPYDGKALSNAIASAGVDVSAVGSRQVGARAKEK